GIWFLYISIPYGLTEEEKHNELHTCAVSFLKSVPLLTKKVYLGFGGEVIPVRKVTVPEMPKEELPQALRWAVRSQLPFDVEHSLFEFEVLAAGSKKEDALVIASQEEVITGWVLALQEAGFWTASVASAPLAFLSWLTTDTHFCAPEPIAFLDVGTRHTTLYLLMNGRVSFIRELEIGGETVTHALTRPLATERGDLKLNLTEAQQLKHAYGFPVKGELPAEKLNASQMVSLMRPVLERMANEIKRSFDYYETEFGGRVQKLYLFGGAAQLKNLDAFLSEKLGIASEFPPIPPGFQCEGPRVTMEELQKHFPVLAPALGLAFQQGKGPELLPMRFRTQKSQRIERIVMRLATIVIVISLVVFFIYQKTQMKILKEQLVLSRSSWKGIEEVESMERAIAERKQILAKIGQGHPYLFEALGEIANLLPQHAVLSHITTQGRGTDALRFSGTIFSVANKATETLLGELISGFEKSPYFTYVELVSSQRDETYDRPASNFEILCRIRLHR
ncbi:MAG: pilus assembly protein PilM, partial [Candidatus Omnitrophota bacterium]